MSTQLEATPVQTPPETTDQAAAPTDDAAGRRPPGWAWELPGGPGGVREARVTLAQALEALGASADLIADARLMVSELATNAFQHAGDRGPYELWLYLHDGADAPDAARKEDAGAPELRCAIFDRLGDTRLPGYSWTSGDCGRGLSIVRELSGGRWGTSRERSRCGDGAPGKAVWFVLPPDEKGLGVPAPFDPGDELG
ncbi:ATP-binding protein [Thermomonospora umbrina]|uniref:Anti-sigma regulatory factor (Ser/Thr protein kinase) n=1 Tax=Thermomonospora umbrina TaxID=111806 RepID=A0A3D9SVN6_9ACTN|nr:ATP-binding protein [Thermomonospora umbrina]REE95731.1 anti-sigma regulatory factor (Ser/Thr protein kinase) [Thermomonospora umbrina]